MYPILFSIGGVNFYSYGLLASIAFFSGALLIINLAKKNKLYYPQLFDHLLWLFLAALFGARLSYFIVYNNQFNYWYEFFYLWNGGMISYGGMLGVLLAAVYIFKKDRLKWLDIIGLAFLLGVFFWRIGCVLTGDHPQIPYSGFLSINGEFPAILIESLLGIIGFAIFFKLFDKLKKIPGLVFFQIILFYGLVRIFVDNFRIDPEMIGLSTGQVVGMLLVVAALIGIILIRKKSNVT
ncbi:hypothetical protein A3F08_02670 [Candidatus Berkelbacteria bacterium RIFCSPHIGHO2_12_FULL_36_9]|uniref:Phosphatidylglycerol--prolipoprotein diacylglyceryl transferase n=1 Tax=Candidatus Berkelbacteria bacterium RIFCSPHIGHO2_12_FULL_36_9 TaxID=1797469 RepID=A0A1F5EDX0_9BACT|nr:MAG: hypothetical protein A3F08_02670 [Candidatus Berkelbacteria bacterium RIFCSPHIGHO2_12_FULL_36_9]